MLKSKTYIAIPPGATIKEQLEDRGISQKEFAARMELSEKHVSKLINGEVALTYDVANRLEFVLGLPARFWNNLEADYREKIIKVNEENSMDLDKKLAIKFPCHEMIKNGWIPENKDKTSLVISLRKYFEVSSLESLGNPLITRIACRRVGVTEKADYALLAWAQQAKLIARNMDTDFINIKKLKSIIPIIRSMTNMNPEAFVPRLIDLLSKCGIALVLLPHIGGSFLHGATFLDGKKIVIGLTIRGKDADRFWFSLFHEIGHIIYGHINQQNGTSEEDESRADLFARDSLVNPTAFKNFVDKKDFQKNSIIDFSKEIGIACGIIVGRLQKEGYIKYSWLNDLKVKYEMS